MKILISGYSGFIGKHLIRALKTSKEEFNIEFLDRSDFKSSSALEKKIFNDDCIFHFAGVNRAKSDEEVFKKNQKINSNLFEALNNISFKGKLFFTSSTQETSNTAYGKSKKAARIKFLNQSVKLGYKFHGVILPNVFGPFCKPNYNSFIATFCNNTILNKSSKIENDIQISLVYVGDLIKEFLNSLKTDNEIILDKIISKRKVSEVLTSVEKIHCEYIKNGNFPNLDSSFDLNLFNTFRSYIDLETFFPKQYNTFDDERGMFTELIRASSKGQSSVSITYKGAIRGNHYHTRKIERFSVIKGKAKVQIREVLSDEIINFYLDGESPSFIDIPIWFTHNIENIGEEDLITVFWINEHYSDKTSDTYIEIV